MTTPEIWTVKRTWVKGREYIEFRDQEGKRCNLQQAISSQHILLGRDDQEMKLSSEQVVLLMYNLSHWLEYGTMMTAGDPENEGAAG